MGLITAKNTNIMQTIIISFSGGKTSAYLAYYMLKKHKDKKLIFIFANTGKEREETLNFINECDKNWGLNLHWIEAIVNPEKGKGVSFKKVSYETASRNGEPFEALIKKFGVPNTKNPFCTRDLKDRPIHKYIKSIGIKDYYTAIGIRADEAHRIKWDIAKKKKFIYPLATEQRVDRKYIDDFWEKQPFNLALKSYEGNCDMCYKKSTRKLLTLITEEPARLDWWVDMELKYGDGYTFYRNNTTALDLIEMTKKPFHKFSDSNQQKLFDSLDFEASCFCS